MIKFEKVSLEQYTKDMKEYFPLVREDDIEKLYDSIKLPKRGWNNGRFCCKMRRRLGAHRQRIPNDMDRSEKPRNDTVAAAVNADDICLCRHF